MPSFLLFLTLLSCDVDAFLTIPSSKLHHQQLPNLSSVHHQKGHRHEEMQRLHSTAPSWQDLEEAASQSFSLQHLNNNDNDDDDGVVSIDSVLQDSENHIFSSLRPTFFRERHGWCPYSERAWLALEIANVAYDTIRIDNTGGGRPSYFAGQTPQIRWPGETRNQGESMDLVARIDRDYYNGGFGSETDEVQFAIKQFRNIFPKQSRPSSRAAFLFQYNGEPIWKSTFESTLEKTDQLLGSNEGPFFCGTSLTAADIAWAPFLERYRYQLPCLHSGLEPDDEKQYPHLTRWYKSMDQQVPAYACRVRGDASSWRKVLTMAGFGNAGVPPTIQTNMKRQQEERELNDATEIVNQAIWDKYIQQQGEGGGIRRALTPRQDAGQILVQNREAILRDALKNGKDKWDDLQETSQIDDAMRALAQVLLTLSSGDSADVPPPQAIVMAQFLDYRMCVPRDMGAMSAACIKMVAHGRLP